MNVSRLKTVLAVIAAVIAVIALALLVVRPGILLLNLTRQAGPYATVTSPLIRETDPPAPVELGKYEIREPDPMALIYSEDWGTLPANQLALILDSDLGPKDAKRIAADLGCEIVGEIEILNFYQIENDGVTEEDLRALLAAAKAVAGVKIAAVNIPVFSRDPTVIEGEPCSPLNDPMYKEGDNGRSYEMIGLQEAWDFIRASEVDLNRVKVGVIDEAVYTKSGHEFSKELHLPDEDGKYPEGKVRTIALDKDRDLTDSEYKREDGSLIQGGLGHGTSVAHLIGAEANSGTSGIAAILGSNLELQVSTKGSGATAVPVLPPATGGENGDEPLPEPADPTVWQGFSYGILKGMLEQVKKGATLINLSFGPSSLGPENENSSDMMQNILEIMQERYPKVLFVAAAGNSNQAVDGKNDFWGKNLPNLITVGALNQDGGRAKADAWRDQTMLENLYQEFLADGSLAPDSSFDDMLDSLNVGSNFEGPGGEITLSACGSNVPVGLTPDGRTVLANGTSFAAPQVTSAAALIRSINPELSAADIKQILQETAAREVKRGDTVTDVPENMGAGVLRVDEAVLRVINDLRIAENKEPLTRELLSGASRVKLQASGEGGNYALIAMIPAAMKAECELKIEVTGSHSMTGPPVQKVGAGEEAGWQISLQDEEVFVRVSRLDNGACATLTLKATGESGGEISPADLAGTWRGTMIMEKAEVTLSSAVATLDDRPYPGDLSDLYLPDLILQINEDGSGTAILGGYDINLQYVDEIFIISETMHTNTDINFIFRLKGC